MYDKPNFFKIVLLKFVTENSNTSTNGIVEPYNPWPDYVFTGEILLFYHIYLLNLYFYLIRYKYF